MSDFASRLYSRLSFPNSGENLFFSPFSIQVALAMCSRGAVGETRKSLVELLGTSEDLKEQDASYKKLIASVNGDSERPYQLVTANALWGQQDYVFKEDYVNAVKENYDGNLNKVNFVEEPDKCVKVINAWVNEKTKEKIKELIKRDFINKDTRLILTNAIYFKSEWKVRFRKTSTKEEDFFGTKITKCQLMRQQANHLYYEGDGFQAVDIAYKGGDISMLVVLPTKKDGLSPMEIRWQTEGLYEHVIDNLENEQVDLALPRFKLETEFKLKPVLVDMGAKVAFSDEADFTLIGDDQLKISEVIHKAFVEVNEEGTEAAAATAVGMIRKCSMRVDEPKVFRADHPFMFFIRDRRTNAILFSGRVVGPK